MTDKARTIFVPNSGKEGASILFVGEAPGETEESGTQENGWKPEPLIGMAGEKFTQVLGRNGVERKDVFLANLSHYRPQSQNKFEQLLHSPELEQGIKDISDYLEKYRPNVVCALGNYPMHFLTGKGVWKKGKVQGINKWRGSILSCSLPGLENIKVIPTYHPSLIIREATKYPIFDSDIARVVGDSTFSDLKLPLRKFIIDPKFDELEYWVQEILKHPEYSVDIENTKAGRLLCVGFAISPETGICIVNDGSPLFDYAIERLLVSDNTKIFHFRTHDIPFLKYERGLVVKGKIIDTYVNQHVMNPELPKTLAFIGSILTRQQFWKDDKSDKDSDNKDWTDKTLRLEKIWPYNCIDTTVTIECKQKQELDLQEKDAPKNWRSFIDFEMSCFPMMDDIGTEGLFIDDERLMILDAGVTANWIDGQNDLNELCGFNLNVNSNKDVPAVLYDGLGLPEHRARATGNRTADEDALISLLGTCKKRLDELVQDRAKEEWQRKYIIVKLIWMLRGLRKKKSTYINFKRSKDGKLRGTWKQGPETGRWAGSKWVDRTGFNMQTLPRDPIEFLTSVLENMDKYKDVVLSEEEEEEEEDED